MRSRLHLTTTVCAMALCLLTSAPLSHAAGTAAGATIDQSRFEALHWRGIGPYRGGRVLAVTGVPG
jgi:Spy/CpxP family protein refolding chaperone